MEKQKIDMSPLDGEQMVAAKKLIEYAQRFADEVKQIMVHYKLWHKGFDLKVIVDPQREVLSEDVQFQRWVEDGEGMFRERIERVHDSEKWRTLPYTTSREFIHLFDEQKDGSGTEAGSKAEKDVPADGMWIGADDDSGAVDGRDAVNNG